MAYNVGTLEPPEEYGPEGAPWFFKFATAKRSHGKIHTTPWFMVQDLHDAQGEDEQYTDVHIDALRIDVSKEREKYARDAVKKYEADIAKGDASKTGHKEPHPSITADAIEQALQAAIGMLENRLREWEAYIPTTDEAANPYTEEDGNIVWRKSTREGIEAVTLTNFTAHRAHSHISGRPMRDVTCWR